MPRSPPKIAITPSPPPTTCVPGNRSPLPITPRLGVRPQRGAKRLERLPGTPPNTPHQRPPTGHRPRHQGMGGRRGAAPIHTNPRNPCCVAALWGHHRGRGEGGLHQAHRAPPPAHDPKPLPGGPQSCHEQTPGRNNEPARRANAGYSPRRACPPAPTPASGTI